MVVSNVVASGSYRRVQILSELVRHAQRRRPFFAYVAFATSVLEVAVRDEGYCFKSPLRHRFDDCYEQLYSVVFVDVASL